MGMKIVAVATLCALAGCQERYVVCDAGSGGADDYAVFGKITAAGSGKPLAGVNVKFVSSGGLLDETSSDPDGCYLRELRVTNSEGEPHRWEMQVSHEGYETYRSDLGMHPAGDRVRQDVALDPT